MRRFAIIGGGRIGQRLADLAAKLPGWTLVATHRRGDDLRALIAANPELVFECASRAALAELAPPLLRAGIDVVPLSLTAFCDRAVERELIAAADAGPGRFEIPPGAMATLEALAAAREDDLRGVVYRQVKSPAMWKTTPAREFADLDAVAARTMFAAGSVRAVADRFPDNLNTAVGVALAGLGLDATHIELIADPAVHATEHELDVDAGPGSYRLRVGGRAVGTGDPVDYSTFGLLRILRRRSARLAI
jgi:aspartate dehydrogenase